MKKIIQMQIGKLTAIGTEGENIFERFASEINQARLVDKAHNDELIYILHILNDIEKNAQFLISLSSQSNVYPEAVCEMKNLLDVWFFLFKQRMSLENFYVHFINDLDHLKIYTSVNNLKGISVEELKLEFDDKFLVSTSFLNLFLEYDFSRLDGDTMLDFEKKNIALHIWQFLIFRAEEGIPYASEKEKVTEWSAYLCISTRNASKSNEYFHLLSSLLGYIDDVELIVIDAGLGSLFQRWIIKLNSAFAKATVKRLLVKTGIAIESYSLDRHTEPIERSKIEKEKTNEELKRMMTKEDARELHRLTLEDKREEIKAKKIANIKATLELNDMLTERLAKGLIEIDSDFRLIINELLVIKRENGKIEISKNIQEIDKEKKTNS